MNNLFPENESRAIISLLEDDSVWNLEKQIGSKLMTKNDIIVDSPRHQISFIVSLSTFADSEKECHTISDIVFWGIKQPDIIPKITEYQGKELAYRCLLGLSFFRNQMQQRTKRKGSPSPEFYMEIGAKGFLRIGEESIAKHFNKWIVFLPEVFS